MEAVSPIPRDARPYQGRRAGLVTRGVAAGIDLVVAIGMALAVTLGVCAALFVVRPWHFSWSRAPLLLGLGGVLVLLILYLATAWSLTGRSFGGALMGLRVLDRRGERPRLLVALARAVLSVSIPIGLLWCLVGPGRRSLQDVMCRTTVVYDWRPAVRRWSRSGE